MEDFVLLNNDKEKHIEQVALMPIGYSDFEKLRKNKYYYIDKTGVIAKLLRASATVDLFTSPRHFGKTLTMSTLKYFLSIKKGCSSFSFFLVFKL